MVKVKFIASMVVLSAVFAGYEAKAEDSGQPITEHITANGKNTVTQPEKLKQRLMPASSGADIQQETETASHVAGYRIQIFSDNNPRTAKSEARSKARSISEAFPQYRTYVTYNSPYWRLKVGDFRNQQDANEAADEIKKAFPSYSREIRIVRDRINITE